MILIKVKIRDLNINYLKEGEGKTVLILPGWGTVINTYKVLTDAISQYAKVYCLDMPGFGESDEPKEPLDINDYVEIVKEFIKKEKIKELDLIGHSNGGRVIIKLMNEKDLDFKVGKIILIGSAGVITKKKGKVTFRTRMYKMCKVLVGNKLVHKIFPGALEKVKCHFGSEDYRNATPVMRDTMVKLINVDLTESLKNINVPTLLLWGENDDATPIEHAKIMEREIPDAGLVSVKGCSHYVFLERPGYINNVIKTFIG